MKIKFFAFLRVSYQNPHIRSKFSKFLHCQQGQKAAKQKLTNGTYVLNLAGLKALTNILFILIHFSNPSEQKLFRKEHSELTKITCKTFPHIHIFLDTIGSNMTSSIDECSSSPCLNGGSCRNAYFSASQQIVAFCLCPAGFIGEYCGTARK